MRTTLFLKEQWKSRKRWSAPLERREKQRDVVSRDVPTGPTNASCFSTAPSKIMLFAFGPSLYHAATSRIVFAPVGPAHAQPVALRATSVRPSKDPHKIKPPRQTRI